MAQRLVCAGLALAPACWAQPIQLTCEQREGSVVAVESTSPRFEWSVSSTQANQSSFQLQVSEAGTIIWDSGLLPGSNQSIVYGGPALNASTRYDWTIASDGRPASANFVTGVWNGWQAAPIWHPNASSGFTFFRAEMPIRPIPVSYVLAHATANPQGSTDGEVENSKLLAAYKLLINGNIAGMGPGRPGRCGPVCPVGGDPGQCSCAPEHVYDSYDVTQLITDGAGHHGASAVQASNVTVAVQAFNYPPGGKNVATNQTSQILVQLVVVYTDGSRDVFGTGLGSAWRVYNADAYFNPTCCTSDVAWYKQPAENADARLEPVGWRLPGYVPSDSAGWTDAVAKAGFTAPLVARPTRPIAITQGVQPASVIQLAPGHLFIDFGLEFQGGLTLNIDNGVSGSSLQVRLGEELATTDPPSVMYDMRTGNKYIHTYTMRDGPQVFEHHEYLEFRYVEIISGATGAAQCVRTAPADYTTPVTLGCSAANASITAIEFASWGTPSGSCSADGTNSFQVNASCACTNTSAILAAACVGKSNCTFVPSDAMFCGGADPCHLVPKYLAASVTCSGSGPSPPPYVVPNVTAWVLTYPAAYASFSSTGTPGQGDTTAQSADGHVGPLTLPSLRQSSPPQVVTSDPVLNSVWSMCQYTVVATAVDMYTDSNTRQRSVICAEALHINLLMQYATSTERAMQEYTLAYTINNRPSGLGWAEWQALTIMSVHAVYLHTGDLSMFEQYYDHLKVFTELSLVNATGSGLWTCDPTNSFYCRNPEIDWPSNMRDGFVFVPADTVVNAYTYRAMSLFVSMASDLGGHEDDVALFSQAAETLRDAMNAQLLANSINGACEGCNATAGACTCYVDGLGTSHTAWHSSVYALAFGIPTDDAVSGVYAYVADRSVGVPDLCQPGNVYPAQWALEAFFTYSVDYGATGLALLTCNGTNSWVAMLRQNATTTSEAWNAEEKPNETWSHSWAASPADIVPRFVLGVRPLLPGFKKVLIQPQLGTLTWAEGTVPTGMGPISIAINQSLGSVGKPAHPALAAPARQHGSVPTVTPVAFNVTFNVPGGTTARLCLPATACPVGDAAGHSSPTRETADSTTGSTSAAGSSSRVSLFWMITLDGQQLDAALDGVYACLDPLLPGQHTATCTAPQT